MEPPQEPVMQPGLEKDRAVATMMTFGFAPPELV
jgi:hypothetical protein